MFHIDILFNFFKENKPVNNTIYVKSDIEKSEIPGKKQNENTISYCVRMIDNGLSYFNSDYILDYEDIQLPYITKKIILENKGSIKRIDNGVYIYHSHNDKYFIIWQTIFGYGWKNIEIKNNDTSNINWDIENQFICV